MSEEMIELAERCEKATAPDHLLDADLAAVLGWTRFSLKDSRGALGHPPVPRGKIMLDWVPKFTASLDAAMTLYVRVPERVPSSPRLASAEALRQRAEAA